MTLVKTLTECWEEFFSFVQQCASVTEFQNWIAPIKVQTESEGALVLEVPNVFVQEYLLANYEKYLREFFPLIQGKIPLRFSIMTPVRKEVIENADREEIAQNRPEGKYRPVFNPLYTFEHFIEGPSNQFVKSAALGIAMRPGKSYNPLFIHGGVGLGKTHLLHAIAHYMHQHHKKLKVHCMTTEAFINDLVDNLRNKSLDAMKRYYRSLDVLLVDDIQFLRLNFEEEFCNMFESLIHQNKQIVITSDKPPSELKLSDRLIGRMEWGLVANIAVPDLETRVAILQHKAEQKGVKISHKVAFFIAERIFHNVRQLEGALNRLAAYAKMMRIDITEETVENTLSEVLHSSPQNKVGVDQILKSVAVTFGVKVSDLCSSSRTKSVAFPRQVAMYLAKELVNESLMKLASYFGGKTHSTLLHAWKKIAGQLLKDETLKRQIQITRRTLDS